MPVVVVPPSDALDRASASLSTDRRRSAAFALQDYLNAHDEALWGLATNGTMLRLMRDNASLTRPAYVEANLAQIFETDDIASFAVLWSLSTEPASAKPERRPLTALSNVGGRQVRRKARPPVISSLPRSKKP